MYFTLSKPKTITFYFLPKSNSTTNLTGMEDNSCVTKVKVFSLGADGRIYQPVMKHPPYNLSVFCGCRK